MTPITLLTNLGDVFLSHCRIKCVLWVIVPCISGVSIETASNFLLFLNVAMILRESLCQLWKLNCFFKFCNKSVDLLFYEGKGFPQKQSVNDFKKWIKYQKATNLSNSNITFIPPINTFALAGNIIVHTPTQGTNRGKNFNHNIYEGKMPTLARNTHLSVYFCLHRQRFFHLSTENNTCLFPQKWTSRWFFPRDTTKNTINKSSKRFSERRN